MTTNRYAVSVVVLTALLGLPAAAQAATILVNTTADALHSAPAECTLRGALEAANTDAPVNACAAGSGDDTIKFLVSGTITLVENAPDLVVAYLTSVTLDGSGQQVTVVGGPLRHTLLFISSSTTVRLNALTIGSGTGHPGRGIVGDGGSNLVISNSTFAGHSVGVIAYGKVTLTNSTFANNGVGVQFPDLGGTPATVQHSTFYGNGIGLELGAIQIGQLPVVIGNNIFSSNTAYGCTVTPMALLLGHAPALSGGSVDYANANVSRCGSAYDASAIRADPLLGPLAANDGSTQTFALLDGSAAIDAGSGECPATDQRGQPRPVDGDGDGDPGCDIGAFEHPRVFNFTGFLAPVDNLPVRNTARAGTIIPISFSLDGYQGLDILASGYPRAQLVPCSGDEPQAPVEEALKGKASGLSYDSATDTYVYAWRTEKAWRGTCRQLLLQLTDGQIQIAKFGFK